MGGPGGEAQGGVRPRLEPVAHGECSQPSHGTGASSAGPVPELWLRHDAGLRILSELPGAPSPRQTVCPRSDHRDRGTARARRRCGRSNVERVDRAKTLDDTGSDDRFSDCGGHICGGCRGVDVSDPVGNLHGGAIRIADAITTVAKRSHFRKPISLAHRASWQSEHAQRDGRVEFDRIQHTPVHDHL